MKPYTVQVGYNGAYANTVTVEAETPEQACAKAIDEAGDDSNWRPLDHCSDSYVDAIAEGDDVDPWANDNPLTVPLRFTEDGTLHPINLELLTSLGELYDALRWVLKEGAPEIELPLHLTGLRPSEGSDAIGRARCLLSKHRGDSGQRRESESPAL